MFRPIALGTLSLLLSACTHHTISPRHQTAATLYDYRLTDEAGSAISLAQAVDKVEDADIVLVGELHTHPALHLLEAELLAALQLHSQDDGRALVLSMEQFSRGSQPVLDAYLAGQIGEAKLIRDSDAWPNYGSDYRPLVEFAKSQRLTVLAANAPKPLISCIGQEGPAWLDKLPATRRSQLARELTLGDDPYRQTFMASMHHGDADSNDRRFAAQTGWDDTMAETMVDYLRSHPGRRIMHIAGNFHVEGGLGLASRIASRNPALKVALVVPQSGTDQVAGRRAEVGVSIEALPKRWQSEGEMKQDMGALHQSRQRDCNQWLQP
jgi:uncharacterized iron-regulated protein